MINAAQFWMHSSIQILRELCLVPRCYHWIGRQAASASHYDIFSKQACLVWPLQLCQISSFQNCIGFPWFLLASESEQSHSLPHQKLARTRMCSSQSAQESTWPYLSFVRSRAHQCSVLMPSFSRAQPTDSFIVSLLAPWNCLHCLGKHCTPRYRCCCPHLCPSPQISGPYGIRSTLQGRFALARGCRRRKYRASHYPQGPNHGRNITGCQWTVVCCQDEKGSVGHGKNAGSVSVCSLLDDFFPRCSLSITSSAQRTPCERIMHEVLLCTAGSSGRQEDS